MPAERFTFAWVDETETTFNGGHDREDEKIFAFTLGQSEGNFASLTIDIQNPYSGLLATGRKQWAWFGVDSGSGAAGQFFGRLVAIQNNMLGEVITLEFTAEPADYAQRKQTVFETLKVPPYFDSLFLDITERDNPDSIEGYSSSYHIDRTTQEVTISDWLIGEDGTQVFTADDVFYDSVSVTLGQAPLQSVSVNASVTWSNASSGTIDFGQRTLLTYTGASLISDWPKPGGSVGGGWSVFAGSAVDNYGIDTAIMFTTQFQYQNRSASHAPGDEMSLNSSLSYPLISTSMITQRLTWSEHIGNIDPFNPDFHDDATSSSQETKLYIPLWSVTTNLVLRYDAGRSRTENVAFTLDADLQPVLTLPTTADPATKETITLSGGDVGMPIQANDFITGSPLTVEAPPIGDASRNSYFSTDRGIQSLEYLISLARAKLLMRARAVDISFDCTLERALALSCRMSATLQDPRLPGGTATGKIISYQITGSGDDAKFGGTVTIGCAIGNDGQADASAGLASYVDNGYVDVGYQYYDGALIPVGIGDVAYTPPTAPTNDAGMVFPLTKDQVVLVEAVRGTQAAQEAAIAAVMPTIVQAANLDATQNKTLDQQVLANQLSKITIQSTLEDVSVWYDLQLKAVDAEGLDATFDVPLSPLFVPKLIDLAAPASP